MPKRKASILFFGLLFTALLAMEPGDTSPDPSDSGNPNDWNGWVKRNITCEVTCDCPEDSSIDGVVVSGQKTICEKGAAPSCTLRACEVRNTSCYEYRWLCDVFGEEDL